MQISITDLLRLRIRQDMETGEEYARDLAKRLTQEVPIVAKHGNYQPKHQGTAAQVKEQKVAQEQRDAQHERLQEWDRNQANRTS